MANTRREPRAMGQEEMRTGREKRREGWSSEDGMRLRIGCDEADEADFSAPGDIGCIRA